MDRAVFTYAIPVPGLCFSWFILVVENVDLRLSAAPGYSQMMDFLEP